MLKHDTTLSLYLEVQKRSLSLVLREQCILDRRCARLVFEISETIFAPRLLLQPTCRFPKQFCRLWRTLLPAHLVAIHLCNRSQPTVYLYESDKVCAKKENFRGSSVLLSPIRITSLVSDLRKLSSSIH